MLFVNIPAVADGEDHHRVFAKVKNDPIVSNAEAILPSSESFLVVWRRRAGFVRRRNMQVYAQSLIEYPSRVWQTVFPRTGESYTSCDAIFFFELFECNTTFFFSCLGNSCEIWS